MTNAHAAWDWLIGLEQMTLDTQPAPADYVVGETITGQSSGKTAVVVAVISSTVYLIKDRDGAFTDGEEITDETGNTIDLAAGYPAIVAANAMAAVAADADVPKFLRDKITAIQADIIAGGSAKLTREQLAYLGQALSYLGTNVHEPV